MTTAFDVLRAALAGPLSPLATRRQFICWRLVDGVKVPTDARGFNHSAHDPAIWMDAETAIRCATDAGLGVAFVLTDDDPFHCLDIDDCYDAAARQWSARATELCQRFAGCAIEVSQSGTGLHIWMSGSIPEARRVKLNGLELYSRLRFIALTGNVSSTGSAAFTPPDLALWVAEHFPPDPNAPEDGGLVWHVGPIAEWSGPTDDTELIRQFLAEPPRVVADAAAAFGDAQPLSNASLWNADTAVLSRAFPPDKLGEPFDRSRADMSLAMRLAIWTGKDAPRVERLMAQSALARDRWTEAWSSQYTRNQHDIAAACGKVTRVLQRTAAAPVLAPAPTAGEDPFRTLSAGIDAAGTLPELEAAAAVIAATPGLSSVLRASLAIVVQQRSKELLGSALPIKTCRAMVTPQHAEMVAVGDDDAFAATVMTLQQMLERCVYIAGADGVIDLEVPTVAYRSATWRTVMAASMFKDADDNMHRIVDLWLQSNLRKTATSLTFAPGRDVFMRLRDGTTAVNSWRAIVRDPRYYVPEYAAAFVDHVRYLFEDKADAFLDWLAHIEQKPGELPHFGWLHVARSHGLGRGWLFGALRAVWDGNVTPALDLQRITTTPYNESLSRALLAIVDEAHMSTDDTYGIENQLRKLMTEDEREINPKYGVMRREINAARWLIASNNLRSVPIDERDRRLDVVVLDGKPPRAPDIYKWLYAALYGDRMRLATSVGLMLAQRDISRFEAGARPVASASKQAVIDASKSQFRQLADQIVKYWPADVITMADIINIMNEGQMLHSSRGTPGAAITRACEDAGMVRRLQQVKMRDGLVRRVWYVRNANYWKNLPVQDELLKATNNGVDAYGYLMQFAAD